MSRMLRASAVMAAGTLVSRLTGFVRTAVLASAIGVAALGNAYNVAYTIPFILFDLLIGGLLSSVVVPMIVKAQQRDADGGRAYEQRLMTLATLVLAAVAVAGVLCAPLLVGLLTTDLSPRAFEVATTLARYILPQIAFFGIGAVAGAVLNTRDRFAAPMWAPVLNNVVVIAVALAYLVVSRAGGDVAAVTDADLLLLGLGTTAGIVIQSIVLVIAVHRAGFRFVPRLDLRNARLGEMGRAGVWTLAFVVLNQISFIVITNLATGATGKAAAQGAGDVAGIASYSYAFQLFQLPYGIIAVSVITAMLPRMSRHVHEGRPEAVGEEFASGVRLVSSVMVPSGLLLMVLGPAATVLIFAHGNTSVGDALAIGNVLQVFGLALVPFSIYQLLLRVFYSFGDTRTPALIAGGNMLVTSALGYALYLALPPHLIVMGLALAYTAAYSVGAAVAWRLASRRVGGLGGRSVASGLARMYVAAVPAAAFALLALWATERLGGVSQVSSAIMLVAGGGVGGLVYLIVSQRMRIAEISSIIGLVAGRVGR
ncbi:murein biosynthesis integral membrane protein MurJ [Sphaerisporangium sp. TRM90804]|uniref:murein biosynthesis integral membrane protein MurJ n=1 Tax=Sphaerisporangium sp. TRM90804 TaxID=3031113 RepID=UPI0024496800|nr:murein biosynthesis integral membrane protein MurJ [Sphaerisporangium sp. TRM90804]MDH2425548.1 murein biosynthesis integral membrane protein MurJ [Sphaerisporangium sp. TRM90804]